MKKLCALSLLLCSSITLFAAQEGMGDDAEADGKAESQRSHELPLTPIPGGSAEGTDFEYAQVEFTVPNPDSKNHLHLKTYFAMRYIQGRKGLTSNEHKLFKLVSMKENTNLKVTCYKDGLFVVETDKSYAGIERSMAAAGFGKTDTIDSLIKNLSQKMKSELSPSLDADANDSDSESSDGEVAVVARRAHKKNRNTKRTCPPGCSDGPGHGHNWTA